MAFTMEGVRRAENPTPTAKRVTTRRVVEKEERNHEMRVNHAPNTATFVRPILSEIIPLRGSPGKEIMVMSWYILAASASRISSFQMQLKLV